MLKLLKNIRPDENGVILRGDFFVTGSTMLLCLTTGMSCLQGAENEDVTSRSVAIGDSEHPVRQPRIPRTEVPAVPSVDPTGIHHGAGVQSPNHTVPCPDCVGSIQGHDRIRHRHQGCRNLECTSCNNAGYLARHHAGRHPYIHGLTGCGGTPLHPHHYDYGYDYGGFGNFAGNCRAGGCYAGPRVIGSPSVERVAGVGCMRISEWPSPSTGLTLTEEQNLFIGTGHCAACQPFCKPAYMNIPDHVWE
jgi:hypothetical protein